MCNVPPALVPTRSVLRDGPPRRLQPSTSDPMRTEQALPIRLEDYRPPDWLVETVDLDVSLDPAATRVRATLRCGRIRRRGARPAGARRRRAQRCVSLKLDGEALAADRYVADARPAHHRAAAAAAVPARDRDRARSVRQHPAHGPLSLRRDLLHPMRGRRLPPHHLFPRPARRDGGLHHAHRGRQSRMPGAARPTAISSRPATCPAPAGISRSGTIRSRSRPICSRWSAAMLACVEDTLPHHVGPRRGAAHLCRARQGRPLRLRHGLAQALHALGRGDVRPRIRSRHLHDRRGLRLQHGRDGEQGPQRLQRQIRAGQSGDRDRHRLLRHRGGHRARIFPQLDRQPHHLPRLVPALPEGRADRLPRSGIPRRRALARRSSASATCAALRAHQFAEDAGPLAHPVRPSAYREINNFYTATVYEKGAEVVRMLQTLLGRGRLSARAWTSISTATTARRRPSSSSCSASRTRAGADLTQFMLLVLAGRHAGGRRRRHATTRAPRPTGSTSRRRCRRRPGQPTKEPMLIPLAVGLVGRDGRDLPLQARRRRRSRARRARLCASRAESFVFAGIAEPPVPSLNRGFSAPVRLGRQPLRRRPALPRGARHRSVQSLAGGADAGDAAAGRQRRGDPRRRRRRAGDDGLLDALAAVLADARARARLRRAGADAAERGRHRARDRARRRSRRDLRGAHRAARGGRRASRRRAAAIATGALTDSRALSPGRRGRRTARAAQCLPRSPGRGAARRARSRSPRDNTATPTT